MWFPLNTVFQWIATYRYAVLLPAAIIEGPIVSIIAGFLVSLKQMNFWIVLAVLVAGDVIGDMIFYSVGRWGRKSIIGRWGPRMGLTEARIETFEKFFKRNAKKALLIGKWGHALGAPILVSAGATKEPVEEFLWVSFLGTVPKSLLLMVIGIYFGAAYGLIDKYFTYAVTLMIVLVAVIAILYWFFNDAAKRYFLGAEKGEG